MADTKTQAAYKKTVRGRNPIAIGALLAIIAFVLVAPELADGNVMSPTIDDGNVIVLQKKKYSLNRGLPDYGDVVVFTYDYYDGGGKDEHIFSRIIGLPGDKITIKDEKVYRNGKEIKESGYKTKGVTTGEVETTLGETEIFVLGDNRSEAIDSRDERVGELTLDMIRGKCLVRLWPLNGIGIIE